MPAKTSTKHPYAAIEHRVLDSPAYADLTFSARSLLILIARQLTRNNNGRLHATYSYLKRFGFDSEHTLSRAIKELISHGFIYRTRSGGYQQGAAQYAVTWLSISQKEGLFLAGFVPCAWRDWKADEKKLPPAKVQLDHCKNGIRITSTTAKSAARHPPKSADTEYVPIDVSLSTHVAQCETTEPAVEFQRISEVDQTTGYWDTETGEFIKPLPKQKVRSSEIDRVAKIIQSRKVTSAIKS